jgi:hypothetical protein|tara:strand:- start:1194 stop:1421 length:228 start_codon:yes stop_codon:yes gene_type:complete
MKNKLGLIVGGTTFVLFMTEAIMHFNMGQNYKKHKKEDIDTFKLPDTKELGKLALVVGIFSIMNGVIISEIKKTL